MENNELIPKKHKILDVYAQTDLDITYIVEYHGPLVVGTFLQVSIPRVGEAPISVSDFGDGFVELTIRKVGTLTDEIYNLNKGDYMYLRGPYGNGFDINQYKNKHLIVVTGGTGLAPVKQLVNYFSDNKNEVKKFDILLGFKSPKDVLFKDSIAKWKKNANVIVTVDSANALKTWDDKEGLVTEFISEFKVKDIDEVEVIVVGSPLMMKFTVLEFLKRGIPKSKIWVSFERKMSCGVGKCGHCKIDDTYVCVDGPVFDFVKGETLID